MKSPSRAIDRLTEWYEANCDGDWEHQYGIQIGTLDNPGWFLEVDLEGTLQSGRALQRRLVERSENDWVSIEARDNKFVAHGGPRNLAEMIDAFWTFVGGETIA